MQRARAFLFAGDRGFRHRDGRGAGVRHAGDRVRQRRRGRDRAKRHRCAVRRADRRGADRGGAALRATPRRASPRPAAARTRYVSTASTSEPASRSCCASTGSAFHASSRLVKSRLLPASLVALLLIYLQLRSGSDAYLALALASAALAYVTMATGRLLLVAARAPDADVCAAWTMGLLGICLGIYALTAAFPLSAATAFGIVAVVVLGLEIALARRRHGPLPDWRASIGFALCVAFTAAWCNAPAGAYEVLRAEGMLPVWPDFFIHGGLISQFGDPRAIAHQSILSRRLSLPLSIITLRTPRQRRLPACWTGRGCRWRRRSGCLSDFSR